MRKCCLWSGLLAFLLCFSPTGHAPCAEAGKKGAAKKEAVKAEADPAGKTTTEAAKPVAPDKTKTKAPKASDKEVTYFEEMVEKIKQGAFDDKRIDVDRLAHNGDNYVRATAYLQ